MPIHLPTIGASSGTWGDELNEFLGVGHNSDGTIAPAGTDTCVQFNDNGVLGYDLAYKFDKVTNTLYIPNIASLTEMTFTDSIVGTRTLKQLGCPTYKYLKAESQSAGDLHLSGVTWAVSKAWILSIRVITVSTGWSLSLLQNDNGYAANDADYPLVTWGDFDGNALIKVNDCYQDEDGTDEVHLYYDGASSADIYVKAIELL